jgi:hypothetical protein
MNAPPEHTPIPHAGPGVDEGGVRCSCGEDYWLGRPHADTAKGNPSKRKIRTMAHAWAHWRDHAYPPEPL